MEIMEYVKEFFTYTFNWGIGGYCKVIPVYIAKIEITPKK